MKYRLHRYKFYDVYEVVNVFKGDDGCSALGGCCVLIIGIIAYSLLFSLTLNYATWHARFAKRLQRLEFQTQSMTAGRANAGPRISAYRQIYTGPNIELSLSDSNNELQCAWATLTCGWSLPYNQYRL